MAPGLTNAEEAADESFQPTIARKSSQKILPWHFIQDASITSIEHPFLVQSLEKGFDILGGEEHIMQTVAKQDEHKGIELALNPMDPMCRPIRSNVASTGDILLKITVPKRTGRKRKRGSNEPWIDARGRSKNPLNQPSVYLRSLRDNADNYSVEVPGTVDKTHRFVDLADFQYSVGQDPLTEKICNGLLDLDVEKIKNFKFDIPTSAEEITGLFPPPFLTPHTLPFTYGYQQNPAVHLGLDAAGQPLLMNTQQAAKIFTQRIQYNTEKIPLDVDPNTVDLSTQEPVLQKIVKRIRELMKNRPIWTRRALINVLESRDSIVKQATQYVGYMFTSGPWRDTIIKYGLDPRTDPSCRLYQSFGFQIVSHEPGGGGTSTNWVEDKVKFQRDNRSNTPIITSHIFDGKTLVRDGKVWQVCDVTDPLLHGLLATKDLRSSCDIRCDGWYHNGLWAKVKTIMRAKIRSLMQDKIPRDLDFARLLQIPDVLDNLARGSGESGEAGGDANSIDNEDASPADLALAHEVRQRASDRSTAKKPVPAKRGTSTLSLLGGMRLGVDGPGLGAGSDVKRVEDVMRDLEMEDAEDQDLEMDLDDGPGPGPDPNPGIEAGAEGEVDMDEGEAALSDRGLEVVSMDDDDVDDDDDEGEDEDEYDPADD